MFTEKVKSITTDWDIYRAERVKANLSTENVNAGNTEGG